MQQRPVLPPLSHYILLYINASPCLIARNKPHKVVDNRLVANILSRLKNLVSRVRWKSVEPMVVMNWSAAMPYCNRKRGGAGDSDVSAGRGATAVVVVKATAVVLSCVCPSSTRQGAFKRSCRRQRATAARRCIPEESDAACTPFQLNRGYSTCTR